MRRIAASLITGAVCVLAVAVAGPAQAAPGSGPLPFVGGWYTSLASCAMAGGQRVNQPHPHYSDFHCVKHASHRSAPWELLLF